MTKNWTILLVLLLASVSQAQEQPDYRHRWKSLPSLPEPREQHACEAVNGVVYTVAGIDGNNVETARSYAFSGDYWRQIADYPLAVQSCTAEDLDGHLIVTGGYDHRRFQDGKTRAVYRYSPQTDTWQPLAPMNIAREDHGSAVLAGKLYVFGGLTNPGHTMADTCEVYDPNTDCWELRPWQCRALGDFACVVAGEICFPCGVDTMQGYPLVSGMSYVDAACVRGELILIGGCRANIHDPNSLRGAGTAVIGERLIVTGGWRGRSMDECWEIVPCDN